MRGGSRRWILQECENSLRRLGTDYIDLYQIHRPDDRADIDETLGALSDLVHQGKIRYFGHSTFPAEYIVEAQWVSERRNRERFVCEQPPYSIFMRGIEQAVLPTCQKYGIGVIPWSPLAGRLARRPLPPRPRGHARLAARPRLRSLAGLAARRSGEPGPPRPRRVAREDRRPGGHQPHPHGPRVRARAPGGDVGDHRAAHDGTARRRARGRRRPPRHRHARRDRRRRRTGHRRLARRPLAAARPGAVPPAPAPAAAPGRPMATRRGAHRPVGDPRPARRVRRSGQPDGPDELRALFTDDGEWVVHRLGRAARSRRDRRLPRRAARQVGDDLPRRPLRLQIRLDGDHASGSASGTSASSGSCYDGTEVRIAGVYHDDYGAAPTAAGASRAAATTACSAASAAS